MWKNKRTSFLLDMTSRLSAIRLKTKMLCSSETSQTDCPVIWRKRPADRRENHKDWRRIEQHSVCFDVRESKCFICSLLQSLVQHFHYLCDDLPPVFQSWNMLVIIISSKKWVLPLMIPVEMREPYKEKEWEMILSLGLREENWDQKKAIRLCAIFNKHYYHCNHHHHQNHYYYFYYYYW